VSLTAAQICAKAANIARLPGFLTQAGDWLNLVLNELAQNYDFSVNRKTYNYNFNPSQVNYLGQAFQNLPADYLRSINRDSFYVIQGVPYPMIQCDLNEFDQLVQQAGLSNFPVFYATDMSLTGASNSLVAGTPGTTGVPVALFWQVPSGAYPVTQRYYSQPGDIANPSTSNIVPWFPNQNYLVTRVAGQLMMEADDERAPSFLSEDEEMHPMGAGVLLRRYLAMQGDKGTRVQTVQLDRRRFGSNYDRLKNTKSIGW
jgi:hypothetical protein